MVLKHSCFLFLFSLFLCPQIFGALYFLLDIGVLFFSLACWMDNDLHYFRASWVFSIFVVFVVLTLLSVFTFHIGTLPNG
jgi:hypothetical protein